MDNGSGGFMTDLTFNGGKYGAFFGNQQFTTRNLTFNNCQTAVFMNWNWVSLRIFRFSPLVTNLIGEFRHGLYLASQSTTVELALIWPTEGHQARLLDPYYLLTAPSPTPLSGSLRSIPPMKDQPMAPLSLTMST